MAIEQRGDQPTTDSQKEWVAKNLHTETTTLVRTHVPEPRFGAMTSYLRFKPIIIVLLPTENGSKTIAITGTDYPWSNTNSPMNNSYTIEDSSSEQKFVISTTKITTATDPKGKGFQENSEHIRKLLAEIADPKAEIISGRIEIESRSWGYV